MCAQGLMCRGVHVWGGGNTLPSLLLLCCFTLSACERDAAGSRKMEQVHEVKNEQVSETPQEGADKKGGATGEEGGPDNRVMVKEEGEKGSSTDLRVLFLAPDTEPSRLDEVAMKTEEIPDDRWSEQQRKLVKSVHEVWRAGAPPDGNLTYVNLADEVKFEISQEEALEDEEVEVKVLKFEDGMGLRLSTCEHLFHSDAALCVGECCYFRLLEGAPEVMHSQLTLHKACFDLSDEQLNSYPLRLVSVHTDQCEAGFAEDLNLAH